MAVKKYLVLVSTRCAGAGEIGEFPVRVLCDSEQTALESFKAAQITSRALIEREIAKIAKPENRLIFNSPYISNAALVRVPGSAATAEAAEVWISEQLAEGEDLSEHVLRFEGFSAGPEGEAVTSLDTFFDDWG